MTRPASPAPAATPGRGSRLGLLLLATLAVRACGPGPVPTPEPPPATISPSPDPIPKPPPPPVWTGPGAILEGRVRLLQSAPPLRPYPVVSQTDLCGPKPKPNETLVVDPEGGIANLVVMLPRTQPVPEAPVPAPPVMDQRACVFVPHLVAVAEGDPVRFRNSDPTLHNVHGISDPGGYDRFNLGMPGGGVDQDLVLKRSEAIRIRCDAGHRWMRAILYVTPTRLHAVSDRTGRFRIPGIPEGSHPIEVWHETLGRLAIRRRFGPEGTVVLDLEAGLDPAPFLREVPVLATPSTPATTVATVEP